MVGGAFAMAAGTVVPATIAVAAAPSVSVIICATAVRSVCVHVFPQFGASCNYLILRTHSSHFHRRRTNIIGTLLSCSRTSLATYCVVHYM